MMNYNQASEFIKDIRTLSKRIPTLAADIKRVTSRLEVLSAEPTSSTIMEFRQQFFAGKKASVVQQTQRYTVFKMRLDTDTDNYRRALRLVFIVVYDTTVKPPIQRKSKKIHLVEVYSTKTKPNHDERRVKRILRQLEEL